MNALDLIMLELAHARAKHTTFAHSDDQTVTVLTSEVGEYASAVLRGDVQGQHGAIREAAQVAAVCIRAIEYWTGRPAPKDRTCGNCGRNNDSFICAGGRRCEGGRYDCKDWTRKEASRG